MSIEAEEMLEHLLKVCPSAKDRWSAHLEWWGTKKIGYYNDMAVFALHVVESYQTDQMDELPQFFESVEQFITNGDDKVRDLATIGLLEDIQDIASERLGRYDMFEQWLGPISQRAWKELEQYQDK